MKFDMEDIDWKALDFFLEEVENGYYSKEELLNSVMDILCLMVCFILLLAKSFY